MLRPNYTSRFKKDVKRLKKKHIDMIPLRNVMQLIIDDTPTAKSELKRRHNNAGDWLLIWTTSKDQAYFQRTGSHDELFA